MSFLDTLQIMADEMKEYAARKAEQGVDLLDEGYEGAKSFANDAYKGAKDFGSKSYDSAKDTASELYEDFIPSQSAIDSKIGSAKQFGAEALDDISNKVKGYTDGVKTAVSSLYEDMSNITQDDVDEFIPYKNNPKGEFGTNLEDGVSSDIGSIYGEGSPMDRMDMNQNKPDRGGRFIDELLQKAGLSSGRVLGKQAENMFGPSDWEDSPGFLSKMFSTNSPNLDQDYDYQKLKMSNGEVKPENGLDYLDEIYKGLGFPGSIDPNDLQEKTISRMPRNLKNQIHPDIKREMNITKKGY